MDFSEIHEGKFQDLAALSFTKCVSAMSHLVFDLSAVFYAPSKLKLAGYHLKYLKAILAASVQMDWY